MTEEALVERTRRLAPILEQACVEACRTMWEDGGWTDYELREGYRELWRLNEGKDLAYDRPSIGLHYSLWYHLQRTHILVRALARLLAPRRRPVRIYDLGCGSGATAWAAATFAEACLRAGTSLPRITVLGTDSSPFMVDASRRLWASLPADLAAHVELEHRLGNWSDVEAFDARDEDALMVCSYLLNASDGAYLREIDSWLQRVSDRVSADQLLVLSSPSKADLANVLQESEGWVREEFAPHPDVWTGDIGQVAELRGMVLESIGKTSPHDPSWTPPGGTDFRLLSRARSQFAGHGRRSGLTLNDEQEQAAEPTDRLTALVGAAGSGKSLVLCERVVRIIERADHDEPPWVLVTSFNKRMVDQLVRWTLVCIERSDEAKITSSRGSREEGDFTIEAENWRDVSATVRFLNRDKLATRVWQEPPADFEPFPHPTTMSPSVVDDEHLDGNFLSRELELVVFGLEALDHDTYLAIPRDGRKRRLTRLQRAGLWRHLVCHAEAQAGSTGSLPFIRRRMLIYAHNRDRIEAGLRVELRDDCQQLTHLYVDEAQDMTRADLRLLAHTPPRPQRLFVAGDSAQALHTGGISPRPRIHGARWQILRLLGSYRLPALVCEAVSGLATRILDEQPTKDDEFGPHGAPPEVRRSAVPGPRPIVVNGSDPDHVHRAMRVMGSFVSDQSVEEWHVVSEPDATSRLNRSLTERGMNFRECSLLKTKGLELPMLLFPSDVQAPNEELEAEWVYAALTRAQSVLMIAVVPERTSAPVAEALSSIDSSNVMFWDASAESAWSGMIQSG